MAEGDTILRLARRIEAAFDIEPLAVSAASSRGNGDSGRATYRRPRCRS